LRGEAELIFGNLVIQIYKRFKCRPENAERRLKKYSRILNASNPKRTRLGIATDLTDFVDFKSSIQNEQSTNLVELSLISQAKYPAENRILWIDAFLFSQDGLKDTSKGLDFYCAKAVIQ
jgi:hypothetical protein